MGALTGLKILDFTTLLPGPYATMMLADLGAEVLKVSGKDKYDLVVHWPPEIEGAGVTGTQAWLGRNKKNIYLNLKKPEALLLPEADTVSRNKFRVCPPAHRQQRTPRKSAW